MLTTMEAKNILAVGEMVDKVRDLLIKHLKSLGAYSNGYDSYVAGSASKNYCSIATHTPDTDMLTGKELRAKNKTAEDQVITILKHYNFEGTIRITNAHIEHGVYEMYMGVEFDMPRGYIRL